MRFSDRIGATQPEIGIHLNSMPDALRTSLWNIFVQLYGGRETNYWREIAASVATFFRKTPVDELPHFDVDLRNWLKKYFFQLDWYDAYNFLEFIIEKHEGATHGAHRVTGKILESYVNSILEREHSGYRFIAHILSPISEQAEVEAIQEALGKLQDVGLDGARTHIHTALDLFSKRPNPDYRNAIKEAISAIESIAKQIGASDGDGLVPALRALDKKAPLHGALRSAFEKLYGYTSDENGIRHAILEESSVGFDEAKYMIVACSAFANYLAAKADKAGLLK